MKFPDRVLTLIEQEIGIESDGMPERAGREKVDRNTVHCPVTEGKELSSDPF